MDFATLTKLLDGHFAAPTQFTLAAANDLQSPGISSVIADYLPGTQLTLTGAKKTITGQQYQVAGAGVLFRGGESHQLQAVFTIVGGVAAMTVTTTDLPNAYSLGADFATLVNTSAAGLLFDSPSFALASGAGLSFEATPAATGSLAPFLWMFADLDQIVVSGGPITLAASGAPTMKLTGTSSVPCKLGPISSTFGLLVESTGTSAAAYLTTSATIGAGPVAQAVPLQYELVGGTAPKTIDMQLSGMPYTLASWNDLSPLAGGFSFASLIPASLPAGMLQLSALVLEIDITLKTAVSFGPGVAVSTTTPWQLLPAQILAATGLQANFNVVLNGPKVTATVTGFVSIETLAIQLSVTIPTLSVTGSLAPTSQPVSAGTVIDHFLAPLIGPIPTIDGSLQVSQLEFTATPAANEFDFTLGLTNFWPLPLPLFDSPLQIQDVVSEVSYGGNDAKVKFTGNVTIFGVPFTASIAKADAEWHLSIAMDSTAQVPLLTAVSHLVDRGITALPLLPSEFAITALSLDVDSPSLVYKASAGAAAGWDITFPPPLGVVTVTATAGIETASDNTHSGSLSGSLKIGSFVATVDYAFAPNNSALTFSFDFRGVTVSAALTTQTTDKKQETILTASVGNLSFGDIVTYLAGLVDPNTTFSIDPPWDFLNAISFDDLRLVINLSNGSVGIEYDLNKEFVIVNIVTIGLTYVEKPDGSHTVMIAITGRFVDQKYTDTPLTWDLLNDAPPQPPGKGSSLLDLKYLGLAQSVGLASAQNFSDVQSVITALRADFTPPDDGKSNPIAGNSVLKFTGDGRWMIGVDVTIMETVSLAGVFNDPGLYGLRIALSGDKAKALSGLTFEVLYHKVTDTVGVYHIALTLPESMRHIELGEVSITLPSVALDIYTNGGFRVDFGFPAGGDFSNSAAVQLFPFVGAGGFYFAYLTGGTSTQVPTISNGTFSPVIEFGLGLSVGIGKTINEGILSAGATLTVQGIIEGVIGWFNPTDRSAPSDTFYHIRGQAGIVGHVYGVVDFVIITVSVDVLATATATLIIESHQPTQVDLRVHVEASASIKIVFFTVHFSFGLTVDLSFSIGSASATPWLVTAPAQPDRALRQNAGTRFRMRVPTARRLLGALRAADPNGSQWNWQPQQLFPPRPLYVSAAPSFTVVGDQVETVMTLWIPSSVPQSARTVAEVRRVDMDAPEDAPFSALAEGVLRWALGALVRPDPTRISADDLDAITQYLADEGQRRSAFTYDNVTGFLGLNYSIEVGTPLPGPTGPTASLETAARWGRWARWAGGEVLGAAAGATAEDSAAAFPMIPALEMGPQGLPPIDFSTHNAVGATYEARLGAYLDALQIDPNANVAPPRAQSPCAGPSSLGASSAAGNDGDESLATFVFRDYFAMIARATLESAVGTLKQYPYSPAPTDTLSSIASSFATASFAYRPRKGETIDHVAMRFGVTADELTEWNPALATHPRLSALPQGELRVEVGVTPQSIATANVDHPLASGWGAPVLPLNGVRYQVRSQDTIASIANAFQLASAASLFAVELNAINAGLFVVGQAVQIPQGPHFTPDANDVADNPLLRVAAFYAARVGDPPSTDQYEYLAWYTNQIATSNSSIDFSDLSSNVGTPITVPVGAVGRDNAMTLNGTVMYAIRPADTIDLIAATFELVQLQPDTLASFVTQLQELNPLGPVAGEALTISAFTRKARPTDSLEQISNLFGASFDELLAPGNGNVDNAQLLAPLAVLVLPTINWIAASGDTLGRLAARFDLQLSDLARSVAGATGIFPSNGTPLTIPDVPELPVDQLVQQLHDAGHFNAASAVVTRFLLHGLRIPVPSGPGVGGLYDLVGQQFSAPSFGPTGATAFHVQLTKGPTPGWFEFATKGSSLDVVITEKVLQDEGPSLTLDPEIVTWPTAAPLYVDTAPRYALDQSFHWQSATMPSLPFSPGVTGVAAGQPSIWFFPDALEANIAGITGPTGTSAPFELLEARPTPSDPAAAVVMDAYAWGTAIPFRVRRAPADATLPPNGYVVAGADATDQDRLLALWTYLDATAAAGAEIYVLYQPSASSENANGLASDALDRARTFILKSNLSTVTHSSAPPLMMATRKAVGDTGDYFARLQSPADFLRLLWECSVTNSGGFYLNYVNGAGGGGLPDGVFGASGDATLWILAFLENAPSAASGMLPFNNCAVVAPNPGVLPSSLYAQLADPTPAQQTRIATAPPGVVGFELSRTNPTLDGATGPEVRTQSLFNLVGYHLRDNGEFMESPEGLPAGPLSDAPGTTGLWSYRQLMPASRFAATNALPACTGLPAPSENPYAGIAGATGPAGFATIALAFQDIYGNRIGGTALPDVHAPVGYTDPLLGVGSWPGLTPAYLFETGGAGVELLVAGTLQTDRYLPGPNATLDQAAANARADGMRYRQIYYQVAQPDVNFALSTNLGAVAPEAAPKPDLLGFVAGAYTFAQAASQLQSVGVQAQNGDTLATIGTTYGVTPAALVQANASAVANQLFSHQVAVPFMHASRTGDTLASLASAGGTASMPGLICPVLPNASTSGPRVSGIRVIPSEAPVIPSEAPVIPSEARNLASLTNDTLTAEDVAANNLNLPLTNGITLSVPSRSTSVGATGPSLSAVAAAVNANVYYAFPTADDPNTVLQLGLVGSNFKTTDIVAPGVPITIGGVTEVTGDDSTFASLYSAFASVAPSVGQFARAISGVENLLRDGAPMSYADRLVRPTAGATALTLGILAADYGNLDTIADANRGVPSIFSDGSPVFLNSSCVTLDNGESLGDVISSANVSVGQFAAANSATPLAQGACVTIPDLVRLPADTSSLYAPYRATSTDTVGGIATRFGCDPTTLASLDQNLPYLLRSGASITCSTLTPVVAGDASTFASVYQAFVKQEPALSFATFAAALASQAVLREGARMIAPAPRVPAGAQDDRSLSGLAARFGLIVPASTVPGVGALALANQSIENVLRVGAVIAGATGPTPPTLTAQPYDTLVSLSRKFQQVGTTVGVADLASINATVPNIFTPGQTLLIPPASIELRYDVAPAVPPQPIAGESAALWPVQVAITAERDPALVAPAFRDVDGVATVQTTIGPLIGGLDGARSVYEFAQQFEAAFAPQKLKLAATRVDDAADSRRATEALWAVYFGAGGIERVSLEQNEPAFYAIPPISTQLLAGSEVSLSRYQSGSGLCCPPLQISFQAVDLDNWMGQLVNAVDLVLSAPYALQGFQIGATGMASPPRANSDRRAMLDGPMGYAERSQWNIATRAAGATAAPCNPCAGATAANGPVDYETLVSAKADIANGLASRVESILLPAPQDPYYLADAREALRQQLLVRLSDAYTFDAVVQYPVDVRSPFSSSWSSAGVTGPVPPRLSGSVATDLFVSAPNATFGDVATQLGVAASFLCWAVRNTRGLLRPSVRIAAGPALPYVTTTNDTLANAAAYFGISDQSPWAQWRNFANIVAQIPALLVSSSSFPLVRAARLVLSGDFLAELAAYFNTSVETLGRANESLPGLFAAQSLSFGDGNTYQVKGGQTLVDIVAGINTQFPAEQIDVDTLCARFQSTAQLAPSSVTHWIAPLPNFTTTTAKLSLGAVDDLDSGRTVPPALTFLLGVKDEALSRKVFLNLRYAVNQVEHAISDVAGTEGYQASSWLTLIVPFDAPGSTPVDVETEIEQVSVPLPLRFYPTVPSLIAQTGAAVPGATTIAASRLWDYSFTYGGAVADQDTTYLNVSFGTRRTSALANFSAGQTLAERLFAPLAQFIYVYPDLQADLAQLPSMTNGNPQNPAAIAFHTFAQLVDGVAGAFRSSVNARAFRAQAESVQSYQLQVDSAADPFSNQLVSLDLHAVGYVGPTGGNLGPTSWPGISVADVGGTAGPSSFRPLTRVFAGATSASYTYPADVPADGTLLRRMEFDGRDILQNENGWAGVWLTRNEDLIASGPLGPTAPTGATAIITNPDFVYSTPLVQFVDKVTPFILDQSAIPVPTGPGRTPLPTILEGLFEAMLDLSASATTTGIYTVRIACGYCYPIASPAGPSGLDDSLIVEVPILLAPSTTVSRADKVALAAGLGTAITAWVANAGVASRPGRIMFDITVFSTLGDAASRGVAGATGATQPIWELANLQLDMSTVEWPSENGK